VTDSPEVDVLIVAKAVAPPVKFTPLKETLGPNGDANSDSCNDHR